MYISLSLPLFRECVLCVCLLRGCVLIRHITAGRGGYTQHTTPFYPYPPCMTRVYIFTMHDSIVYTVSTPDTTCAVCCLSHVSFHRHTFGFRLVLQLFCWGYNGNGQLGLGSNSNQTEPRRVKLPTITPIVQVGVGGREGGREEGGS